MRGRAIPCPMDLRRSILPYFCLFFVYSLVCLMDNTTEREKKTKEKRNMCVCTVNIERGRTILDRHQKKERHCLGVYRRPHPIVCMLCVCVCAYKRIRRAIYTPSSELDTSKLDNIDSHLTSSSSFLLAYFPDIHNTTFLLTPNIVKQVNKSWPRIFSCRPCYAHFILS